MTVETDMIALRARVAELEDRLEFVYRHLGIKFVQNSAQAEARVIELIKKGNLIEAIKIYREIYNVGLAEAKKAVDALQERMGM